MNTTSDPDTDRESMPATRARLHKLWLSGCQWPRVWAAIHEELLAAADRAKYEEPKP